MNDNWPKVKGPLKINTVLQYDEYHEDVISWGAKALSCEPSRRDRNNKQPKPVELFKLHLGDVPEEEKPKLPEELTPIKAITDYLREIGNYYYFLFVQKYVLSFFRELIFKKLEFYGKIIYFLGKV